MMLLIVILIYVGLYVLFLVRLVKNAPEGYQNERGFHYGRPDDWDYIYEDELRKRIDDAI